MPHTEPLALGNLLEDPLIGVADAQGVRSTLTLPHVLARLADPGASTVAFTTLQSHQAHAWHAFLTQVAAMVCQRAQASMPPTDAGWWSTHLRDLGDGDEAWTLVVSDLGKPGFMQPPVPEGSLTGFANRLATPGAVDLLVTAKNHDHKLEGGDPADLSVWMYALVSLQTGQGFSGKNNYGIFRMNGGFGSRPSIGIAAGIDLGVRFRRDIATLLDARDAIVGRDLFHATGAPLLWCVPWDGTKALPLSALDPWAVECCRRVRLRRGSRGGLEAMMTSTQVARVCAPKELTGNVGDPWTPIGKASRNLGKSLTLPSTGFTYQRVAELLLSNDWVAPPTQRIHPDDTGDLHWYGRTLVRGQGKTEGWHEREVPIPSTLGKRFAVTAERERLAKIAIDMVELAKVMRLDVLKPALRSLWEDSEGRITDALIRLEQRIDEAFFPHLWEHPDHTDAWRSVLADTARTILDADIAIIPPNADRWRRISAAQARFGFLLRSKDHPKVGHFLLTPAGNPS